MLSPDQAQDLVAHFGSIAAAARGINVHRNTFDYWLDPERQKSRQRAAYAANPEPRRAQARAYFHGLRGPDYARHRLKNRRVKALTRMAEREARRADGSL